MKSGELRFIAGRCLLFALFWWLLVEGRLAGWGLGLVAIVVALVASLVLSPPRRRGFSSIGLLAFLGFFLLRSAQGGAQVAVLALRPRLALRPTLLELPLTLPPGAPRTLMINALGLMPGTVAIRITDDRLQVHALDERMPIAAEAHALERRIARLFGAPP
ncbi:MAG: Na+/H+ antiporter subunit E [Candidatus Accumulibacter sp. UW26]|jgi:multicomponent Na+:H+ antiporter subunit E